MVKFDLERFCSFSKKALVPALSEILCVPSVGRDPTAPQALCPGAEADGEELVTAGLARGVLEGELMAEPVVRDALLWRWTAGCQASCAGPSVLSARRLWGSELFRDVAGSRITLMVPWKDCLETQPVVNSGTSGGEAREDQRQPEAGAALEQGWDGQKWHCFRQCVQERLPGRSWGQLQRSLPRPVPAGPSVGHPCPGAADRAVQRRREQGHLPWRRRGGQVGAGLESGAQVGSSCLARAQGVCQLHGEGVWCSAV